MIKITHEQKSEDNKIVDDFYTIEKYIFVEEPSYSYTPYFCTVPKRLSLDTIQIDKKDWEEFKKQVNEK